MDDDREDPQSTDSDQISLGSKMRNWLTYGESEDYQTQDSWPIDHMEPKEPGGHTPSTGSEPFRDSEDEEVHEDSDDAEGTEQNQIPGLTAYRDFISGSQTYRWLLARLKSEALLDSDEINVREAIRETIVQSLPASKVSRRESSTIHRLFFVVEWDPVTFFEKQHYEGPQEETFEDAIAVERAITLTGSARDAQALTCVQYLSQTWPLAGEYTMQVVKDGIAGGYQGRKNGERTNDGYMP